MKHKILVFIAHYLPAYKAGGPLRTIENMVAHLADDFDFLIITGDRDLKDSEPYVQVELEKWLDVGRAKVYYVPQNKSTVKYYQKLISTLEFDIAYLNSFFATDFTIKPLLALRKTSKNPILLAPRGEFSQGAMSIKSMKKRCYLALFSWIYKSLKFQASSVFEANDILKNLPWLAQKNIYTALDLPQKYIYDENSLQYNSSTLLKMIFLSRISPMKNLDSALNILQEISQPIQFDIYGPIEDLPFWQRCSEKIAKLPANITVTYCGALDPRAVATTIAKYDLFFLPTKGENYGHVIAESLSVGTPVLISNLTPWQNLQQHGLGWEFPLNNPEKFIATIEMLAVSSIVTKNELRSKVYKNAHKILSSSTEVDKNRKMFLQIIDSRESVN
ncbi:glycosyltransferase [Morganella morganii]|uniref:glycosyltransferase n=1 Tax=Morganella morganii TaxID=582 RepID=UPI003EBEDC61